MYGMRREMKKEFTGKTIIIEDIASLNQLAKRKRYERIVLNLKGISLSELDFWQGKLNSFYSNCGCSTGAAFMFLSVGFYLILLFLLSESIHIGWAEVAIGVVVMLTGAGIGKFVGISHARYQLRQCIEKINKIAADRVKLQDQTEDRHAKLAL